MNKTELVAAMAEQTGLSKKDAEAALKAFTDVVAEELKANGKVQLVGFGTFEVFFFQGSYSEYEENKMKRLGNEEPKRVRYRKLMED